MKNFNYRITISPDPCRLINKRQKRAYGVSTTREEYLYLRSGVKNAILETVKNYDYKIDISITLWFELNKAGILHAHGELILSMMDHVVGKDIIKENVMQYFQRMIMGHLGREYPRGNLEMLLRAVCYYEDSDAKAWSSEDEGLWKTWREYCTKDQTMDWMMKCPVLKYDTDSIEMLEMMLNITEEGTIEYKRIKQMIRSKNEEKRKEIEQQLYSDMQVQMQKLFNTL